MIKLKDVLSIIRALKRKYGKLSITLLQRNFGLSFDEAKLLLDEFLQKSSSAGKT
jgi:hypothetical protein